MTNFCARAEDTKAEQSGEERRRHGLLPGITPPGINHDAIVYAKFIIIIIILEKMNSGFPHVI